MDMFVIVTINEVWQAISLLLFLFGGIVLGRKAPSAASVTFVTGIVFMLTAVILQWLFPFYSAQFDPSGNMVSSSSSDVLPYVAAFLQSAGLFLSAVAFLVIARQWKLR